jgi:hypothetical protein
MFVPHPVAVPLVLIPVANPEPQGEVEARAEAVVAVEAFPTTAPV